MVERIKSTFVSSSMSGSTLIVVRGLIGPERVSGGGCGSCIVPLRRGKFPGPRTALVLVVVVLVVAAVARTRNARRMLARAEEPRRRADCATVIKLSTVVACGRK